MPDKPIKVLFLCLGNICRSPFAEGIFRYQVAQSGLADAFFIDSAGTGGYHVGELADPRTRQTAKAHGLTLTHLARTLKAADLKEFDYLIAMDNSNLRYAKELQHFNGGEVKMALMRSFDKEADSEDVPDP